MLTQIVVDGYLRSGEQAYRNWFRSPQRALGVTWAETGHRTLLRGRQYRLRQFVQVFTVANGYWPPVQFAGSIRRCHECGVLPEAAAHVIARAVARAAARATPASNPTGGFF